MKKKAYNKLDELFEKARTRRINMSVEEIHQLLDRDADHKLTFDSRSIDKQQPLMRMPVWSIAAAASILLILGMYWAIVEMPSAHHNSHAQHDAAVDTGMLEQPTFSLIDTHDVDELSFWDTSKTSLRRLESTHRNGQCMEARHTNRSCEMLVMLELDQPDECSLVLIDTLGTIVKRLLLTQIQETSPYSYYFDLCQLHAGTYDLVLRTKSGGICSEQILLN